MAEVDPRPELGAIFDPFGNATHTALAFNLVGDAMQDALNPEAMLAFSLNGRPPPTIFFACTTIQP